MFELIHFAITSFSGSKLDFISNDKIITLIIQIDTSELSFLPIFIVNVFLKCFPWHMMVLVASYQCNLLHVVLKKWLNIRRPRGIYPLLYACQNWSTHQNKGS